MPFKSYAQQKAIFVHAPEVAKKWADRYGTIDAKGRHHGPGGKKAERKAALRRRRRKRR